MWLVRTQRIVRPRSNGLFAPDQRIVRPRLHGPLTLDWNLATIENAFGVYIYAKWKVLSRTRAPLAPRKVLLCTSKTIEIGGGVRRGAPQNLPFGVYIYAKCMLDCGKVASSVWRIYIRQMEGSGSHHAPLHLAYIYTPNGNLDLATIENAFGVYIRQMEGFEPHPGAPGPP